MTLAPAGGATRTQIAPHPANGHLRAGVVAGLAFGFLGWRMLLVPTLIRSVEASFGQTDAGMGGYFFVGALLYAAGSFLGGRLLRGFGYRATLAIASIAVAAGLVLQGTTGDWLVFVFAAVPGSFGAATVDVGVNALFLDVFARSRGRALNLLHTAFSVAALVTPVGAASMVGAGVPWQAILAGTGAAWLFVGGALALATPAWVAAPAGASTHVAAVRTAIDAAGAVTSPSAPDPAASRGRRLPVPAPLLVLAIAIACYVGAEAGVSDWLVRFLERLPVEVASAALTLFWAGVTVGRLGVARAGSRLDPVRTAATAAGAGSALVLAAVLVPAPEVALVLFGAVGVAFGPVYPLVVAAAGTRFPASSAVVTSTLTIAAVVGAVSYPPAVGFLSVIVGLRVAMLGTSALAAGAAVALVASRRARGREGVLSEVATT